MPRVKWAEKMQPEAEINWLTAAILYRMYIKKWSITRLAQESGYSRTWLNLAMLKDPWTWDDGMRQKICKTLDIGPEALKYAYPGI